MKIKTLTRRYRIMRAQYWRFKRLLFMSPAEVRFVRIMGGRVITIKYIKLLSNKFPLTIVVSLGSFLKNEKMQREVRVGRYFVDFGNDINRGIEIDGKPYHMDVLKEEERDKYCGQFGWQLLHIYAADLYNNPKYVRQIVIQFLTK